jgi:hypothetical protein
MKRNKPVVDVIFNYFALDPWAMLAAAGNTLVVIIMDSFTGS